MADGYDTGGSVPLTMAGVGNSVSSPTSTLRTIHESVPKTSKSNVSKDKDKELLKYIRRLYDKGKASKKPFESDWQENWDMFNGKQWPVNRPKSKASPNVNVIRAVVMTTLPIMTDRSPSFGLIARDPADFAFADLMTQVLEVWWKRREMNQVIVEVLMDALICSAGVMKVTWDENVDDGVGDVVVTPVDPKRIFVPDESSDFQRNCSWVIHELYMPRGELMSQFPEKAKMILKAPQQGVKEPSTSTSDTRIRVISPVDKAVKGPDDDKASSDMTHAEMVRVWECWLDDETVIEQEKANSEKDAPPEKVWVKKFPQGKVVTVIPDAKCILQEVKNPYKDGMKPFVRVVNTIMPRSFWGEGVVRPLIESQRLMNKVFATIVDWSNKMTNPTWVVDADSGVDPDMLSNEVGAIITKMPNTTVARQDAPGIPPQMFEMYHTIMQLLDTQSGIHEVTQGRRPTGITAAEAIEELQQAAQTRIRLAERNLEVSLYRLGQLVISRMLQFYSEPRVIRLTGREDMTGIYPSYVEFFFESMQDEETGEDLIRPVSTPIEYDEATNGYIRGDTSEGTPTVGQFELDVTTGMSLPYQKEKLGQQAMRLYENQAIDREALLDVLEFPEREEIMRRAEEKEQAAQEQQAAQQQPPPAGAPA